MSSSANARSVCQFTAGPTRPIRWRNILAWWKANQAAGRSSLLFAYSLGKAQRILAGLAATAGAEQDLPGPVYTHGAVESINRAYRAAGIGLPKTTVCRGGRIRRELVGGTCSRAPVGPRNAMGPPVRARVDGICLGLDAPSRHQAPPGSRPRVCALRSRRLARHCWRQSTIPVRKPSG